MDQPKKMHSKYTCAAVTGAVNVASTAMLSPWTNYVIQSSSMTQVCGNNLHHSSDFQQLLDKRTLN